MKLGTRLLLLSLAGLLALFITAPEQSQRGATTVIDQAKELAQAARGRLAEPSSILSPSHWAEEGRRQPERVEGAVVPSTAETAGSRADDAAPPPAGAAAAEPSPGIPQPSETATEPSPATMQPLVPETATPSPSPIATMTGTATATPTQSATPTATARPTMTATPAWPTATATPPAPPEEIELPTEMSTIGDGCGDPLSFSPDEFRAVGGGTKPSAGEMEVSFTGTTVRLSGNLWVAAPLHFTLTPSTTLELDFTGGVEGQLHGIALERSAGRPQNRRIFQLWGTGRTGVQEFAGHHPPGTTRHYRIPVGKYFTGPVSSLVLINSDLSPGRPARSAFAEIRLCP